MKKEIFFSCLFLVAQATDTEAQRANDVTTPLHAMKPDYPVPYIIPEQASVKVVLDRVYHYLDSVTPPEFINRVTKATVRDASRPDTNLIFKPGDYRLTSYEWGVTYSAMLRASETTGDNKFAGYTKTRM